METIQEVLMKFNFGGWALGGQRPDRVAKEWETLGFNSESTRGWLAAKCWCPKVARYLEDQGYLYSTVESLVVRLACDHKQSVPLAGQPLSVPISRG